MMTQMKLSKVFWMIYDAAAQRPRCISHRGGTRSGKTYSTLQFLHTLIPKADKAGEITSVVSESLPHLKRGAIRDFESIIGHSLSDDAHWNATDCIYTYPNGAKLEFFSVDSPDKVLGPARKRLFVNECNHISYDTFRQLAVRTTGLIILDYNPAAVFWAMEKVESRENTVCLKSTYLDNKDFLSEEQIREIESNQSDANWWKVYGLGEVGTLDGLIYSFDTIDTLPDKAQNTNLTEVWGMDFGFTNDPTAITRIIADHRKKEAWVREESYETHMLNKHIVARLSDCGLDRRTILYADCAEPKSIAEIAESGFNIRPCDKDAPVKSDKLKFQLQWMQGWTLHITKDSVNLIKELRNYTWDKDKDGNPLNQPIDKWNHALDSMRYALYTRFGKEASQGNYAIHIR